MSSALNSLILQPSKSIVSALAILIFAPTACHRVPNETPQVSTITCTPEAAAEFRRVVASLNLPPTTRLRLYAYWPRGNCCPMHDLSFAKEPIAESDRVIAATPFDFVIPSRQLEMLQGVKVDRGERNGEKGFVIHNPNFDNGKGVRWQEELNNEPAPSP